MSIARRFVDKITSRESDPINKARMFIMFYFFVAYILFSSVITVGYFYLGNQPQLIRAVIVLISSISLFLVLYFTGRWKIISHIVLILMTLLGAWSNLLFIVGSINVATLQYIWLASALGFYMHGSKWGWFYALINILPVMLYAFRVDNQSLFLGINPQPINKGMHIFVLMYHFALIIFLHHYFFKAFNRNIIILTKTKNQLNETNERLNNTIEEVEQLSKTRMKFLSTMSHELRTPLNGVIGLTNVLLYQDPRKDQEETLAVLKFSAENLLTLVNDILDFNKLDSEMVELERTPFNLSDLISNTYASIKLKAAEKHLDFKLDIADNLQNITLIGDPTRLTQVLLNLLNNAIKFTEKGSIKLTCNSVHFNADNVKVRFIVEDTGIGIEENRHEEIFDEFVQASISTARSYGGTGLGLPIVKKVLELHHSAIKIESSIGKGTKFTFDIEFPYQKIIASNIEDGNVTEKTPSDFSKLNILVVEDNTVNILVIRKTLNRLGIEPDIAENGRIALEMLESNNYDLILMDLYMPELDGYETTKSIRKLNDTVKSRLPIIAITATVNNQVIEDVLEVGMNGYLSKPFHPNDLFEELRKYIK